MLQCCAKVSDQIGFFFLIYTGLYDDIVTSWNFINRFIAYVGLIAENKDNKIKKSFNNYFSESWLIVTSFYTIEMVFL